MSLEEPTLRQIAQKYLLPFFSGARIKANFQPSNASGANRQLHHTSVA